MLYLAEYQTTGCREIFFFAYHIVFTTVLCKLKICKRQNQELGEKILLKFKKLNVPGNEVITFPCQQITNFPWFKNLRISDS